MTTKTEDRAQLADDLLLMAEQVDREIAKAKAKRDALKTAKAELERVEREFGP